MGDGSGFRRRARRADQQRSQHGPPYRSVGRGSRNGKRRRGIRGLRQQRRRCAPIAPSVNGRAEARPAANVSTAHVSARPRPAALLTRSCALWGVLPARARRIGGHAEPFAALSASNVACEKSCEFPKIRTAAIRESGHKYRNCRENYLVPQEGFEPPTPSLRMMGRNERSPGDRGRDASPQFSTRRRATRLDSRNVEIDTPAV